MIQIRFFMGEAKNGFRTCIENVKQLVGEHKGSVMKISKTFTIINYDAFKDKVEYIRFIAEGDEEYEELKELFSNLNVTESPMEYQSISNPLI